jgi:hypothetical protein
MPKGSVAIPLLPPSRGYAPSFPQHLVPPDTVVAGRNVLYQPLFGTLTTRPGYVALGSAAFSANKVTGIYSCMTSTGTPQVIAADTTKWWSFDTSYAATDITGGVNNTGTATDYWRFVFFPQGGVDYIVGTNNVDAVRRWQIGAASYTSPAAFPKCKDVMVLANRVVAVNVIDSGTRYQYGVKWSSVNDATSWPGTAIALLDGDDPIVACRPLNRESGLIYRRNSVWKMTAQAGGDATAFRFDLVEVGPGPQTGPGIVTVEGVDYYHCVDLRVRSCDGIRTQIVGDQINRELVVSLSGGVAHGVFNNGTQSIWWIFSANDAVVYDPFRQIWQPLQDFPLNIYSSHYGYHADLSGNLYPITYFGGTGRLYQFSFLYTNDEGVAIPYSWRTPKFSPDTRATYLPDEIENYFFTHAGTSPDSITVKVYGFDQPGQLDSAKTTLITGTHALTSGPRFQLYPDADLTTTARGRYLQVECSGSSLWGIQWAGGFLYVYPEAN